MVSCGFHRPSLCPSGADVSASVAGYAQFSGDEVHVDAGMMQVNGALIAGNIIALLVLQRLPDVRAAAGIVAMIRIALCNVGIEIDFADSTHRQCMMDLVYTGKEMQAGSELLPPARLLALYGNRVEFLLRRLIEHQQVRDSGWAPPPDLEEKMEYLRQLHDETLDRLRMLLRDVNGIFCKSGSHSGVCVTFPGRFC